MTKVISIFNKKKPKQKHKQKEVLEPSQEEVLMKLADALDVVLNSHVKFMQVEEIAVVLANRLGAVINAEDKNHRQGLRDVCYQVVDSCVEWES